MRIAEGRPPPGEADVESGDVRGLVRVAHTMLGQHATGNTNARRRFPRERAQIWNLRLSITTTFKCQ